MLAASFAATVTTQQRDVPPPVPRATEDSAVVAGTVVTDDVPAAPVRRARVTLAGTDSALERVAFSDDGGRFVFEALPAGRFLLSAAKGGYLKAVSGAVRPGGSGVPIVIEAHQRSASNVLVLGRGAVITGTVRTLRGVPLANATVYAQRYGFLFGMRVLDDVRDVMPAVSDERGVYRIYGLPPGDYVVKLAVAPAAAQSAARLTTAESLERARSGGPPPSSPAPGVTYAASYHPGTAVPSEATTVTVVAGEERGGIDLPLLRVPTADLTGVVVDPAGRPARGARVALRPVEFDSPNSFRTGTAVEGAFTLIRNVPGDYLIIAEAASPGSDPDARPSATAPRTLWARVPITVNGVDQAGIEVRLQPGSRISGRVVFEAGSRPALSPGGISIQLYETGVSRITNVPSAVTQPDGSFVIEGIPAAPYRIEVRSQSGWMLHSIAGPGGDLADMPLDVRAGADIAGLTVTFTSRTTELAGAVQSQDGRPIAAYTVVVFSTNRAFWTGQSRRVRTVRPANDGRFTLSNLPAGEYRLAAVRDVEDGQWFDPSFLSVLVGESIPLTIAEGQQTVQNVVVK